AWVESIRDQPNFEKRICSQISSNEKAIDAKQSIVQQYNEHLRIIQKLNGSEEEVTRCRSFITAAEKQIEKSEDALISLGPCQIPDCVRHHETPRDVEMVEHQQVLNFNYTYKATDEFKNVPLRKSDKQRKIELRSPIKTVNKFNVLLNNDEQEMQCSSPLEPPKEIIPAINLKITEDYNLTLQEISRNFPETINHYDRGYIRISPNSSEERTKIIEYLDKTEKEYVLSEAPTERPIKIVIKGVPPDHSREKITQELESLNYKVLRINHLRNFRLKTLHPIVLVELEKTPNVEEIFKINKVNLLKVTIEAYRRKQRATMRFSCSDFYHSARNCKRKPRCIKCNGSHETRNCDIKTIIENPSCMNCNENGHLASWRGCPKFPVIKSNKAPTYAQKLKTNIKITEKSNTIPDSNPVPQAKPEDLGNFERNFNALKIINDALNRFPNFIEIREKIKLAKNDFEIVNLLLQLCVSLSLFKLTPPSWCFHLFHPDKLQPHVSSHCAPASS
ncbi:hypothetical protein AVEN_8063-2-1, partial [Araneus ventricosus]